MITLESYIKDISTRLKLFQVTCIELEIKCYVISNELIIVEYIEDPTYKHDSFIHKIILKINI